MSFAIVEFDEDNKKFVEIVPDFWINGNATYWPQGKEVTKSVKRRISPNPEWQLYPVTVLKNDIGKQLDLKHNS
jgi:hypothetical protein